MALKHDAQGFLAGDPIDIGRALAVWDDIHEDVRAIRRAITEAGTMPAPGQSARGPAVKAFNEVAQPMARSAPARRDANQVPALLRKPATPQTGGAGGNANRRDAQATAATSHAVAAVRAANQVVQKAAAKPAARDGRGRFVRSGAGEGRAPGAPGAGGGSGEDGNGEAGVMRSIADRIVGAVKESGAGMEEADPAVKAFNEVAQPMARGYEFMTGGSDDKKQVGFLRRIFGTLNAFRKEEGAFNKAANRSLKNLESKPEGGEGGNGGFWGTILSAIMGIGPAILAGIGALFSKIPFFGPKIGGAGAGGVGAGAAGAAGGAAKAGGGLFKGALKKIPLLGALLAVGGAAADIYGSENDDKLSRREKDKNVGKAVGGAGGTIAGMAAGAAAGAFAGPVGMAIGGMVGAFLGDQAGQIIGDTVGGWVNDLRNADIVGAITSAWDGVVSGFKSVYDTIGKTWGGFVDTAKAGWDTIANLFTSAYEGLKSIPVIGPAIQAVETAAKKTTEAASAAAAAAKQKAVEVGTKAVEKGKEVAQATKEKAAEVGTKAVEGVKQGAEYLGNNTTVGKGIKATGQGAAVVAEKTASAAERAYNVTAATAGSALETVMPKGYRHKALFDGIQGGDSLTKYGSYTDEEAAKIRELKTSGANTSANVKGGMSLEVQDKISAQAKKAGLDPAMMQKIAAMESGGNANAVSSTGAIGIYQFTGQTASGVGIKNRFDVDQNIEGGMKLTKQNQAMLEGAGLPVTAENLYMMHQLGPKAAKEVIRGAASGKSKEELSADTQKAMNLNYGAKSKTAADYIATNKKALDDRYAAVTKDTGGAQTAVAKADSPSPAAGQVAAVSPAQPPAPAAKPAAVPAEPANPAVAQAVTPPATPNYVGPTATPVVAAVAVPPVPAGPQAAPVAEAPQVTVPMASNNARQPAVVVASGGDVGQDLRERGIAHIATGGLGGA